MGIVLASGSPRRRELLEMLGIGDFKVIPASEESASDKPAKEAVADIAMDKARCVLPRCAESDVIIAADTLVSIGGKTLGKPKDGADAFRMLRLLSGKKHTVYTGVAILKNGRELAATETTDVFFRPMEDGEITSYIASGEPMDKAGAYGAQGRGAVFIERIEGDFFNVMGLPLCRLVTMLRSLGTEILP